MQNLDTEQGVRIDALLQGCDEGERLERTAGAPMRAPTCKLSRIGARQSLILSPEEVRAVGIRIACGGR